MNTERVTAMAHKTGHGTVKGLWVLLICTLALPAAAQSLSQSQIDQFRDLSRSQQESLAREHGVDLDDLDGETGQRQRQQRPRDVQVVDTPLSDPQRLRERREDDELKPFGYDLFEGRPTTFAPVTEIPLPLEYIVGPGDVIKLQLFGNEHQLMELPVNRDGVIQMPDSGPMVVAGLTFEELKEQINQHVRDQYIGTEVSVSMGELRSMRVFVMGEVRNPGSYTVSSLSTLTNALLVSGGVRESGSLRNVQLKRGGEVIGTLDLYDLLLDGDTSADLRLQPGDTLFIPPVGDTVAIEGEVHRPAIYELRDGETLAQLVAMAGGYKTDAAPAHTRVDRVEDRRRRTLETVDLGTADGQSFPVRDGDHVTIEALRDLREGYVEVQGAAERTGKLEWRDGMRLSDLISNRRQDLAEEADLRYGLIVRQAGEDNDIEVLQFRPIDVLRDQNSDANLALREHDQVLFVSRQSLSPEEREQPETIDERQREVLLGPVLQQLEAQASPDAPKRVATIGGGVRFPGDYPLPDNATAEDLITAGGGLKDSALMLEAEVTRVQVTDEGQTRTELETFPLFSGVDSGADSIALGSRDRLLIKEIPGFAQRDVVELEGEVRFPGEYTIREGDTLADVIERAGGLTDRAFPEGAVFSRERLRDLETERMEESQRRLRRDLLGLQLEAGDDVSPQDIGMLQGLLADLEQAEAAGRLVIDLEAMLAGRSTELELVSGDRLQVPRRSQSVSVFGEVQFSSSHLYDRNLTVRDYIERSGGLTSQADADRVYVVRADGSVWRPDTSRWFEGGGRRLRPGDTVIAPIDLDRVNRLQLATNISSIFSDLAVSAAALRSF